MHNKLQAKLLRDATLESLNTHQLTPSPDNYRVWYEYAAGSIIELNADIDASITQQQTITEALCQKWYTQYLGTDDHRNVDDARIAIGGMLSVMITHLKDLDSSSTHFCDSLSSCMEQLNDQPKLNDVKTIITAVTEEAKKVRDTNLDMKNTLDNLSNEVTALQEDVARLDSEALTDPLTQIMNRRGFDSSLKTITKESQEEDLDCSLIVVDIDHFKKVNDNFGHLVGDKILKFTAITLRQNIRGNDILARYGGEEFAIILPNTNYQGALSVAENLCQAVASKRLTTGSKAKTIGRITISCGVSTYKSGDDLEAFFDRADKCMYQAKEQGRNGVVGEEAA